MWQRVHVMQIMCKFCLAVSSRDHLLTGCLVACLQEQLATMHAMLQIHKWDLTAGSALIMAISLMADSVRTSLESAPNQFTSAELLQVRLLA